MKKYIGLFLCLVMCVPAFANTVKQNNYSEQLNTQEVNDFVTKKVKVNITEVENAAPEEKINAENSSLDVQKKLNSAVESAETQINETTDVVVDKAKEIQQQTTDAVNTVNTKAKVQYKSSREAYIEMKEKNIETLKQKQDQLSAYYDSKIAEIELKMQKIKESSNARTEEQKETIVSLYKKSIESWNEQKDKAFNVIQDEIDILQTEVNTLKNKK